MRDFYDVYMLRELDEGLKPSNLRERRLTPLSRRGAVASVHPATLRRWPR